MLYSSPIASSLFPPLLREKLHDDWTHAREGSTEVRLQTSGYRGGGSSGNGNSGSDSSGNNSSDDDSDDNSGNSSDDED